MQRFFPLIGPIGAIRKEWLVPVAYVWDGSCDSFKISDKPLVNADGRLLKLVNLFHHIFATCHNLRRKGELEQGDCLSVAGRFIAVENVICAVAC